MSLDTKTEKHRWQLHVKPTLAFSRVLLCSLQGLETPNWSRCGQTWLVTGTKAPDNQSVKTQELVFPQTSLEPYGFFIKVDHKTNWGGS
jgi:hypothetical protein